jgi:hypothetical protein
MPSPHFLYQHKCHPLLPRRLFYHVLLWHALLRLCVVVCSPAPAPTSCAARWRRITAQ